MRVVECGAHAVEYGMSFLQAIESLTACQLSSAASAVSSMGFATFMAEITLGAVGGRAKNNWKMWRLTLAASAASQTR